MDEYISQISPALLEPYTISRKEFKDFWIDTNFDILVNTVPYEMGFDGTRVDYIAHITRMCIGKRMLWKLSQLLGVYEICVITTHFSTPMVHGNCAVKRVKVSSRNISRPRYKNFANTEFKNLHELGFVYNTVHKIWTFNISV